MVFKTKKFINFFYYNKSVARVRNSIWCMDIYLVGEGDLVSDGDLVSLGVSEP